MDGNMRWTWWSQRNRFHDSGTKKLWPDGDDPVSADMIVLLQEKMSKDCSEGQTKRDAHPKSLGCLQAEFIVEPDIPADLKVGIFEFPQTYPAWIRISSASPKVPG